jgi:2-methylisocitrate lyase-like PEP mutase family enzyme
MNYLDKFSKGHILVAPGIYDPLSAIIADKIGFDFLYLSGASISYSYLGLPDMSFTGLSEVESTIRRISYRVQTPIICDADNGYGNEINVEHTVRLLERSGAAAIQIEDQKTPKRCGHLNGKEVLPEKEMVLKIKAALETRKSALIIARTDALSVDGLDEAIRRGNLYVESGADVIFIEAPSSKQDLVEIGKKVKGLKMVNMVEGGKTPLLESKELQNMGFSLVIYPGAAIRTVSHSLRILYKEIKDKGTTKNLLENMLNFTELQNLLDIDKITGKYDIQ